MPDFAVYGAARTALLQALARVKETPADEQALQALAQAQERFAAAEEPIRTQIDQAWANNVAAVADTKQDFLAARQALTALEMQVATAVRTRDPMLPTTEELAALDAANAAVETARQSVTDAQESFKSGVTVEQLEAV